MEVKGYNPDMLLAHIRRDTKFDADLLEAWLLDLAALYASGLTPGDLPRAAALLAADQEGRLHIGRCLECKNYEGLAECSLIGDCGGTDFYCGWFEPSAEAEAALGGTK